MFKTSYGDDGEFLSGVVKKSKVNSLGNTMLVIRTDDGSLYEVPENRVYMSY